ncbi:MAG: CHRD domain-containing protein [Bacteroidota bacterium]
MKNSRHVLLILSSVCLFVFISLSSISQAQDFFSARLMPDNPVSNHSVSGSAVFILEANQLSYVLTISPTDTLGTQPDSLSQLREVQILLMGINGDTGNVVRSFTTGFSGNIISGIWRAGEPEPLTDDIKNALASGLLFIRAVTDSGSASGMIKPASGTGFAAHLTPQQEPGSVISDARGTGSFLLTDLGLFYNITVTGIDQITGAHFHLGAPGISGNVVKPIVFNGNTAMGIWTAMDIQSLTRDLREQLLVENIYVNVHSPQYPAGEIRGQILHAGGFGLSAAASSANGTGTAAHDSSFSSATASFVLTDAGLVYHINYKTQAMNDTNNVPNAYFAYRNSTQALRNISLANDATISGVWFSDRVDDRTELMDTYINDLLRGNMDLVVTSDSVRFSAPVIFHKGTNFSAILTGSQERPRKDTPGSGVGHFVLTAEGLRYHISVSGLDTISSAHFHIGEMGVNGSVVKPIEFDSLFVADGLWSMTGDNALSDTMVANFLKGRIYVNVHTPQHPEGEIRGQVLLSSGTDFKAMLTGSQETPPVNSPHMATGNFMLSNEGLVFKITVDSLNITAAHFHLAPPGQSGGPVRTITEFTGNHAAGVWRRNDPQALTDELIKSLLAGDIYVNLHSPQFPAGEIRGQVIANGGWGFVTTFDSTNSQAGNQSFINGAGLVTLNDAGLKYDFGVDRFNVKSVLFNVEGGGQADGNMSERITGGSGYGTMLFTSDSTSVSAIAPAFENRLVFVLADGGNGEMRGLLDRRFLSPAVYVETGDQLPQTFSLEQNYPNPFNPSTAIRFSLPEKGMVNLSIFNILGQKVVTLINDYMNAGTYVQTFNASGIASGIYFYRLNYANNAITKKMILLK